MKKALSIVLVSIIAAACLFAGGSAENASGGSSASKEGKSLVIGLPVNTSDYATAIVTINEWAEKNGVDVQIIEENTQTYASSYVLSSVTRNPDFDVIFFWDFYLDQFYSFLTPLDGSYDESIDITAIDNGDILQNGYAYYNGHPYSVPYGLDAYSLFYRTDLLEAEGLEPPETWDELLEVAKALTKDTDGDGNIDQWGLAMNGISGQVYNTFSFANLILSNGGEFVDEKGYPMFNSEEGVEALQFFSDMKNVYGVLPPDITTYDNNEVHEGFYSGKFAMVIHWPYTYGRQYGTPYEGKIGYAAIPCSEGNASKTTLNAWAFGIPMNSENKELAWDLLKYLISTESGAFEFSNRSDWPFRRSAYELAETEYDIPEDYLAYSDFLFEVANTNSENIIMARGAETSIILGDYIDRCLNGNMTAEEALAAAEKDILALLSE